MALYKGSQKVSGSGNSFNPQNAGTTGQVLSKTASGYEWDDAPATGVGSSNNTYEDIIYLSQSDYDALTTKDPNTLYSTPDGEGGEPFDPSNAGTTGQVLTKTAGGYDWETIDALPSGGTTGQVLTKTASGADWETVDALPSGGTTGQVLTKTADGADWEDAPATGIQLAPNSPLQPPYHWYGTEAQYQALSQYYTDTPGDTVYYTV